MIACTSPAPTRQVDPLQDLRALRERACRFLISDIMRSAELGSCGNFQIASADAAFEADREQLLRLDRELHRQFLQHLLAEAVDDQRQRIFLDSPRWRQ